MERKLDTKDNYFSVSLIEGEEVKILVDNEEVTAFIVPYTGTLKCYLASDKKPILYKDK